MDDRLMVRLSSPFRFLEEKDGSENISEYNVTPSTDGGNRNLFSDPVSRNNTENMDANGNVNRLYEGSSSRRGSLGSPSRPSDGDGLQASEGLSSFMPSTSGSGMEALVGTGFGAGGNCYKTGRGKIHLNLPHSPTSDASLWQVTRLASSYRVLSASGVQDSFYTTNLSWGREKVALALKEYLLLFRPNMPRQNSLMAVLKNDRGDSVGDRYPTSVAITRYNDTVCFLGHSTGAAELFSCGNDGNLKLSQTFAMPPSELDNMLGQLSVAGQSSPSVALGNADYRWQQYSVASPGTPVTASPLNNNSNNSGETNSSENSFLPLFKQSLRDLMPTVSSIVSMATNANMPWSAALATSSNGVVTLDTRQPSYTSQFGIYCSMSTQMNSGSRTTTTNNNYNNFYSSNSFASPPGSPDFGPLDYENASPAQLLQQVRQATTNLMSQDRLCSISFNSNGTLLATGSSSGLVRIWAVSNTREPLHTFRPFYSRGPSSSSGSSGVIKALAFHPTRPYELAVGDSNSIANGGSLYSLSAGEALASSSSLTGNHSSFDSVFLGLESSNHPTNFPLGATSANGIPTASPSINYGKGGLQLFDLSGSHVRSVASGWTAAPVLQLVYSPDGEHLVTAHGARATLQNIRSRNAQGFNATRGGGNLAENQLNINNNNITTALEANGFDVNPHTINNLFDTENDIMTNNNANNDDQPQGRRHLYHNYGNRSILLRNANHALLTAHPRDRPFMINPTLEVNLRQWPSYSLMVWKRSGGSVMDDENEGRQSLGSGYRSSTGSSGSNDHRSLSPLDAHITHGVSSSVSQHFRSLGGGVLHPAALHHGSSSTNELLLPLYAMPGHLSRPLHLVTPFVGPGGTSNSQNSGCVASLAGGEDSTIRFWRVFQCVNGNAFPTTTSATAQGFGRGDDKDTGMGYFTEDGDATYDCSLR